jgi:hypothetical protein
LEPEWPSSIGRCRKTCKGSNVVKDITESPIQALVVNAMSTNLFFGWLKNLQIVTRKITKLKGLSKIEFPKRNF